jgi:hypothetical protein
MRMGEHHGVEPPNTPCPQLAKDLAGVRATVDQHPRAGRGLDEQRVALTHVEGGERQTS